jgi:hypothetical protein
MIDIVVEDMDLQVQEKAKKEGSKSALRKRHNKRASK